MLEILNWGYIVGEAGAHVSNPVGGHSGVVTLNPYHTGRDRQTTNELWCAHALTPIGTQYYPNSQTMRLWSGIVSELKLTRYVANEADARVYANCALAALRTPNAVRQLELAPQPWQGDALATWQRHKRWALEFTCFNMCIHHQHSAPFGYRVRQVGGATEPAIVIIDPTGHTIAYVPTATHNDLSLSQAHVWGAKRYKGTPPPIYTAMAKAGEHMGMPSHVVKCAWGIPFGDRTSKGARKSSASIAIRTLQQEEDDQTAIAFACGEYGHAGHAYRHALNRYTELDHTGATITEETLIVVPANTTPATYELHTKGKTDQPYPLRYHATKVPLQGWRPLPYDTFIWLGSCIDHYRMENTEQSNSLAHGVSYFDGRPQRGMMDNDGTISNIIYND